MKIYRLTFVMHEPRGETEDKYMAEIPVLAGCRAWGDTPAEALVNLQSVAGAFIESHHSKGDELPVEVRAASSEPTGPRVQSELTIAV